MNTEIFDERCKIARKAMDSGENNRALDITREIQANKDQYITSIPKNYCISISELLIDIGYLLNKELVVQEGISLLEDNLCLLGNDKKFAQYVYYNLGNGYFDLFNIIRRQQSSPLFFDDNELNKIRNYYSISLQHKSDDIHTTSQTFVNLGNCYNVLGRVLDAMECYDKALELEPNHGMALGSKGIGLYKYAKVSGKYQYHFLKEAYQLISLALKTGVIKEAKNPLNNYLEKIHQIFIGKEDDLNKPLKKTGITIESGVGLEKSLLNFCLQNRLYLNVCNYCQCCNTAVGDSAIIDRMILPSIEANHVNWPKNDIYLRLSKNLNQIKQEYVSARFLLVLSRYKNLDLKFVDKRVRIIDTLDYSSCNIYVELLKLSFANFYNVLDKVAYFINNYLILNVVPHKVDFHSIWYEEEKSKTIRQQIINTNNISLNALFNIHLDFQEGLFKKIKLIRHKLTHRFLNVRPSFEDDENISESSLYEHTIELAKTTKNAILYLLQFVYLEECKKEKQNKGITLPLYAQDIPDDLKYV